MKLSDEALWAKIEATTVFAEVDPNQKERIILALKRKIMWLAIWAMALTMCRRRIAQTSAYQWTMPSMWLKNRLISY